VLASGAEVFVLLSQAVSNRFRHVLSVLLALVLLFVQHAASAAGRIEWKTKELQEREGGSWRVELNIYLPRAPDVPHVPMKFEFQPVAYYERAMMDGDKLVERVVPLENRQSLIESVDVGFMDSGSGKIESRTRFSFKVTRAHGYEAGEYKVTIRDARNGQMVGNVVNLAFKGENEIIDRRAMVFSGEKKKKKKEDDGDAKKDDAAAAEKSDKAEGEDKSAKGEGDAPPAKSDGEGSSDEPQTIKEKPGGCGCRVESAHDESPGRAVLPLLLGLSALALRRRRKP
jgi:MYXO-CTERM domain-containing protein